MRTLALVGFVAMVSGVVAWADPPKVEKLDEKVFVGKWKQVEVDPKAKKQRDGYHIVEFTEDGKYTDTAVIVIGKTESKVETKGTYQLKGTTIEIAINGDPKFKFLWEGFTLQDGKLRRPFGKTSYFEYTRMDGEKKDEKTDATKPDATKPEMSLEKAIVGTWTGKHVGKGEGTVTLEFRDNGTFSETLVTKVGKKETTKVTIGAYKVNDTTVEFSPGKSATKYQRKDVAIKDGKLTSGNGEELTRVDEKKQ
jgi:uncharacterized protein (TIGR03066 family)